MSKPVQILLITVLLALTACDSPEEKAKSHLDSGASLLAADKPELARLEFKNALKVDNKLAPAWYGLAQVEEHQGHLGKVVGLLQKVIALDATHIQAQVKLGKILLLSGELDKALDKSAAALNLDPKNAAALALRAAVLFKRNDTEGAAEKAKLALDIDPTNVDAIMVRVAERTAAKDPTSAINILNDGIKRDQTNVSLRLLKIRTLNATKRLDEAEQAFHDLIALYPQRAEYRIALIKFFLAHKKPDAAVKEAHRLAADYPDEPDIRLNVVGVLNATQGPDVAKSELSSLIRSNPDNDRFQFALARLLLAQGKIAEAKNILRQISKTADNDKSLLAAKAEIAKILLGDDKSDEAMTVVHEILEQDKSYSAGRLLRALINIEKGKLQDAIADLWSVLDYAPQSTPALLLLATAHRLNGDTKLADDQFAEAFHVSGADAAIGLRYVRFLMRRSESYKAEKVLLSILAHDPGNVPVLRALAQVRLAHADWEGAQDVAEQLNKRPGETLAVQQILGQVFEGQGNFDESIASFQRAHAASPSATGPINSLVQLYIRAGRRNDAKHFLRTVLESDKKNEQALILLARLNLTEEEGEAEAVALLHRARSLNPQSVRPYRELGRVFVSQGNYAEAEEVVMNGLTNHPDDAGLRLVFAGMLEQRGQIEEAIQEYERLCREDPNSDLYANNLAALLSKYRNDRESLQRAYRLAKRFRDSNQPAFKDTLGWIYYRLGSMNEARAVLWEAVKSEPRSATYRYHLGMTLLATRETEAAHLALKRSLELAKNQPFEHRTQITEILENGAAKGKR